MTCTNDHYPSHSTTYMYTHTPQIEEMTVQPRVEQDLRVNRSEYGDMVSSLSSPVVPELCQLVMKLENTVAELANIAAENPGTLWWCVCGVWCMWVWGVGGIWFVCVCVCVRKVVTYMYCAHLCSVVSLCTDRYPNIGLQNGIAIFYEILGFIGQNTRRYPPSRQVLTACLQILGQVCTPLQILNLYKIHLWYG